MPSKLNKEVLSKVVSEATERWESVNIGCAQTGEFGSIDRAAIRAHDDTHELIVDHIMSNEEDIRYMGVTQCVKDQIILAVKECEHKEVRDLLLKTVDYIVSAVTSYVEEPDRVWLETHLEAKVDKDKILSVIKRVLGEDVPDGVANGLVSDIVTACDSGVLRTHIKNRLESCCPQGSDKRLTGKLRSNMIDDVTLSMARICHSPWFLTAEDAKKAILANNKDILGSYGVDVSLAEKLTFCPRTRLCNILGRRWLGDTLGQELASGVYWCLYPPQ